RPLLPTSPSSQGAPGCPSPGSLPRPSVQSPVQWPRKNAICSAPAGHVLPGFKGARYHADLRIRPAMLCSQARQAFALIQGDHEEPDHLLTPLMEDSRAVHGLRGSVAHKHNSDLSYGVIRGNATVLLDPSDVVHSPTSSIALQDAPCYDRPHHERHGG